ncbi:MAG TPA: SpoIIE family protein phosphatase [Actinocrinis sp.]
MQLSDRYAGDFTADDEAVLQQLAEMACAVVQNLQLLHRQTGVALTLQRSILGPTVLPPGFAVHYSPALGALEVGGDWYDVLTLPDGSYGVVIGDVVDHGLPAAAVMGQLRSAARALLAEGHGPARVLTALDAFAELIPGARCATVFCAIVDDAAGTVHYSSAGHPWAIIDDGRKHVLLTEAQSAPLAVRRTVHRRQAQAALPPGSTLLAYTDGLVERRGEIVDVGIGRAADALARHRDASPAQLAHLLADQLIDADHDDDDAFLIYRQPSGSTRPLSMTIPADTGQLTELRATLRSWLRAGRVSPAGTDELLAAAVEIVTNAIEHGSAGQPDHTVSIAADIRPDQVTVTVRDQGRWRGRHPAAGRGRGLLIAETLVDELAIDATDAGTAVQLTKSTAP